MKIKSHIHPAVESLLQNGELTSKIYAKTKGPFHVVLPKIASENIRKWKEVLGEEVELFFAMKSTFSPSLIKEIRTQISNIEVSTLGELDLALSLGFEYIICSGPKNNAFLQKSIEENCYISVDSIDEINRIVALGKDTRVLIRVSNPICEGRNVKVKVSRFGISRNKIGQVLGIIEDSKIILKGFHFHADGYNAEMKKGFIKYFFSLISQTRKKGHNPDIIDIGGGFRQSLIKNPNDWTQYITNLGEQMVKGKDIEVWGDYTFGLALSEKNKIVGRKSAEQKGVKTNPFEEIKEILLTPFEGNRTLKEVLFETEIKLVVEPGFAITTDAGCSFFPVIGTKETSCGAKLVIVDGHKFNLSSNMIEPITDPILLNSKPGESFGAYVVGSLCREDDFLMRRKVNFISKPSEGNFLVFLNTGSYAMSYEQCNPQRHNKLSIISIEGNDWRIEDAS